MLSFLLAVLLVLGSGAAPLADPPTDTAVTYRFHDDSEMTVFGSSNVRDWTMDVLAIGGQVTVEPAGANGLPAVERVFVEVPVDSILSGRDSQNEKAHKALQRNAQPVIYFRSEAVTLSPRAGAASGFDVVAQGELILANERRDVELRAEGTRQDDGTLRLTGEHAMQMTDFDIDPPTALLGALRVSDDIRIAFDVILVPES